MAHSQPSGGVSNNGDAERTALATEALVGVLGRDPRVVARYSTWLRTRGLDVRIDRLRAAPTPAGVYTFGAVLESYKAQDLAMLDTFIKGDLQLAYDWLAQPLLLLFSLSACAEANGDASTFALRVPPNSLPPGRRPRHAGADILRNVRWLYRAKIKSPADSVSAIEREYAAEASRHTDARSVVQNGIKQAEALLSIVSIKP